MSQTAPYSAALSARATPSTQKQKQAPYRPAPILVATPNTPYTPSTIPNTNNSAASAAASTTLVTFRDNKQVVPQSTGSLSQRQQKEWNLMQRVIATSPTRVPPSQSPPSSSSKQQPTPTPSVVRTMSTREHATGNLRDQTRVVETDEAFLTVPTRANPQQSPLLTSTTATFSIVDSIPPGATLARQEMEGKIDAQKRLERERREELERGIENEKAQIDAELDSLRSQLALAQQAQEEGNNVELAASLEESLKAKEEEATTRKFALDIKLKQLAAAIAKNALPPTEPHHTRAASETTIAAAADVLHMAPNPPATLLLRSKEGLDLLDFQSIQQKLLSLVVGNPVHDLFSSILTDFFKRIFVHFTTIDMVKKESLDLTKQRELLYDATREIERELRLLKTKAGSMELTIATQEGMIARRTTELTNARENYYKNLLLIREIVQQHGIHPDLLVDYMPSDIANSDAKLAMTEKQRQAEFAAMTSKIMAAMEQRLGLLLTTLRNTIFGIMQNFQKKIDRCNAKIRSIDVYLSKSRYKMRKQIYVYDALIRGELTPEKIKEIQDKHARDEDIAEAEREARRAAAAAEAAVAQVNEAHEKNLHSARLYTNTNWEELQESHPQGYQALVTLTARHKAQWERMERQARDGDLELMDEDDLNEQLDTVMRDHGQTPRISISGNNTARSNRAESENQDGESVDADSSVPGSARGKGKKDSRPSSGRKGNRQQSSGRKGDKTAATEVRDSDSTGSSRASSRRETQQLSPSSSIAQLLGEAAPARNSTPKGSAARKGSVLHKSRPSGSSIGGSGKKGNHSGKKKKPKSSTDDGDGEDEEEDDFEEAGSHGVGGADDYSSARQQQIEKEWNNVETEHETREKDKEQRARARAAGSASRLGREKSRLMRSAGGTASSSAATSRADSPARGPPAGGRGTSLLRPSAAAAIASAQGAGMDSRSTSRRGSGGAWNMDVDGTGGHTEQNTGDESSEHSNLSSPRTQRSARLAAARREVDSQLHAVDDEVSRATSAAAALEKRNREILERIRALDEERRMLASNSPASGSGQATSSLASPISTRRSSFSHGSVSTADGGSESGTVASETSKRPPGSHPAPPELDDRLTEEARAKAKEERLARIQYASHLERQKKELEKERKMTEKENARLAAKLKQLEAQKKEMHAAMDKIESETSASKATDRSHSGRTRLRFDDESKTDKDVSEVNEHENIFHKIVMRSVGLQVGVPFTYDQQQSHSPVRSETLSGMNDTNIGPLLSLLQKHLALQQQQQQQQPQETKEDSTNTTTTNTATNTNAAPGTYRVVAPGDYPHPLLLEMSALGIDPRHLQLFLQQQLSNERFPIPMFSMEGPVRHHPRAPTSGPSSREGSPTRRQAPPTQTWDLYPTIPVAGFEQNGASIRSYLEGGEDPAQSIQSFPIGFPPRNPPATAGSARRRATANAASQSSPSPSTANPNSLAGISSSLTLSPSQRDVMFKAELKRRKELEKSLNVFARVQARGATSEENAKYVRSVMQMERQKEMERVLKDLDLLKSNMSASSLHHHQTSGGISSASVRTSSISPSRTSSSSLSGQNTNNNIVSHHSLRTHSSASSRSRPSTAGGNMPLTSQTVEEMQASGGWDNYTPRGVINSGVTTVLRSNSKQASYPHVNSGTIQSASNFSLKQARPSSAQINTANALVHAVTNDRRSALLTSVMGEPRMQLQQQTNRKGQSYSP